MSDELSPEYATPRQCTYDGHQAPLGIGRWLNVAFVIIYNTSWTKVMYTCFFSIYAMNQDIFMCDKGIMVLRIIHYEMHGPENA